MVPPPSRPKNTSIGTPILQASFVRKALREEKLSQKCWDSQDPGSRAGALEPGELLGLPPCLRVGQWLELMLALIGVVLSHFQKCEPSQSMLTNDLTAVDIDSAFWLC